jgi:hypothetical protein
LVKVVGKEVGREEGTEATSIVAVQPNPLSSVPGESTGPKILR